MLCAGTAEGACHQVPEDSENAPIEYCETWSQLTVRIGDDEKLVGPGDVYMIPADTEHETETFEEREVIVCKNVVSKRSIKNAEWQD